MLQCLLHTASFAELMRGQDLNRIINGLGDEAREDHPLVFFRFARLFFECLSNAPLDEFYFACAISSNPQFSTKTICSLKPIYPSSYYRRARRSLKTLLRLTRKTDMSSVDRRDMQAVKHALGQHNAVFLGMR